METKKEARLRRAQQTRKRPVLLSPLTPIGSLWTPASNPKVLFPAKSS